MSDQPQETYQGKLTKRMMVYWEIAKQVNPEDPASVVMSVVEADKVVEIEQIRDCLIVIAQKFSAGKE